jgi:hypothetical protein
MFEVSLERTAFRDALTHLGQRDIECGGHGLDVKKPCPAIMDGLAWHEDLAREGTGGILRQRL